LKIGGGCDRDFLSRAQNAEKQECQYPKLLQGNVS
jgi:hypothetical protein